MVERFRHGTVLEQGTARIRSETIYLIFPVCHTHRSHCLALLIQTVHETYSIDLSTSWTNATVELASTRSKAPALNYQALWADLSGTSLYAYDGAVSLSSDLPLAVPPNNELWRFDISGKSGDWSLIDHVASSNFSTLVRSYHGSYAYGNGLGFAVGGRENGATNNALPTTANLPVPGMVMYNISSQQWYNISGWSDSGISQDGAAHFVPSLGPAGLLFVFGGTVANGLWPGTDKVSIFDPVSQQWSWQEVTGAKPSSVQSPCVVGAQGDNDTYEVGDDCSFVANNSLRHDS